MKKITLKEFIKSQWKNFKPFQKRDRVELTVNEIIKFNQIKRYVPTIPITYLAYPFYAIFYLGLFVLVVRYAFHVELKNIILLALKLLFQLWLPLVIGVGIVLAIWSLEVSKYNRWAIDKIIKERRRGH